MSITDYEFFVGRHVPKGRKRSHQDIDRQELKLRQALLVHEKRKLDTKRGRIQCFEIKLSNLQQSKMMANPKYQSLIGMIQMHNKRVQLFHSGKHSHTSMQFQCEFHERLYNLMNEMLNFRDGEQQTDFLEQIYQWASATKKLEAAPPKTIVQPIMIDESMTDTSRLNDVSTQEKSFYSMGGRTWHQGIEPSRERLEQHQYRKIVPTTSVMFRPNFDAAPKSTFPNFYPKLFHLSKVEPTTEEREILEALQTGAVDEGEERQTETQGSVAQPKIRNLSLAPKKKTYIQDQKPSTSLKRQYEDASTYQFYTPSGQLPELELEKQWFKNTNRRLQQKREDEELIQHMQEWSKNRSRVEKEIQRRIDSKIQGSNYDKHYIEPLHRLTKEKNLEFVELMAEPNVAEVSNAEGSEHSSDEEVASLAKRSEQTVAQPKPSVQSVTQNSFFTDRKRTLSIQQRSRLVDLSQTQMLPSNRGESLDKMISTTKVRNLIKLSKDLLQLKQEEPDVNELIDMYKPGQLSVYASPNKLERRPFSVIIGDQQASMFEEQLVEAKEVKERLAKYRIAVPMKRLLNSLVTPVMKPSKSKSVPHAQSLFIDYEDDLPRPGFGLTDNPFNIETDKKSKPKRR